MFEEHSTFIQPESEEIKIWRYLDFTKFVSLIDTSRLFFTRGDKFDDPFEGSWPQLNVEARKVVPDDIPEDGRKKYFEAMQIIGNVNKHWPRFVAINCWHANEYESAAMWKLYLKSDEGIAIQSTYAKLKKAIIDDETVFIGKVNYIDYEKEYIDARNILSSFVHKRKSFEHEKEIRALVIKWPFGENELDFSQETITNGISIKVDLENLIEKIYIAPSAPHWFAELVEGVIKRYDYKFEIVQSNLNGTPLF